MTVGQFMYVIRRRLKLDASTGFFLYVKNTIPNSGKSIIELYNEHADDDLFLYLGYSSENIFG